MMRMGDLAEWAKKFDPDMPVFPLLAQDVLAPPVTAGWVARAERLGVNYKKRAEAIDCIDAMEKWAAAHGARVPD